MDERTIFALSIFVRFARQNKNISDTRPSTRFLHPHNSTSRPVFRAFTGMIDSFNRVLWRPTGTYYSTSCILVSGEGFVISDYVIGILTSSVLLSAQHYYNHGGVQERHTFNLAQ
jgi:hypothetical protein